MIFDIEKAKNLLAQTGMPITAFNAIDENDLRNQIFKEMVYLRFEDGYDDMVDEDLDEELHDFIYRVKFEMKDLDFCLIDDKDNWDGPCISLHVSYRADPSWDQHMEVSDIDEKIWDNSMEQCWEYRGKKDISNLRRQFESAGGTYSEKLESYFE